MTEGAMSKVGMVTGILLLVLALVIFVFGEGLRRWYSGMFFALIGTVTLMNTLRWCRASKE